MIKGGASASPFFCVDITYSLVYILIMKKYEKDFAEYNALMKRLGSKPKTMNEYIKYREGKTRPNRRGKTVKSPLQVQTYKRPSPEVPSGDGIGVNIPKKQEMQYTGDKLVGIGTMHKSNMIPIFKGEDAEDLARMRR